MLAKFLTDTEAETSGFQGWKVVFLVFLLVHGFLLVTPAVYPFIDLPFHLTAATAMQQVATGEGPLATLFTYDLAWRPNVVHLLFVNLPIFPSIEFGNRVFYGLYALLLPLSLLFLVRCLRGDPAISLLGFLLLYNFNVHWGFAGYTLAIPLVLLFLGGLVLERRDGSRRRRGLLSLLLVGIFLTHALAALFASLLVLLFAAESLWRDRRLDWWWVPLPMWAILLGWWIDGQELHAGPTDFDLVAYYRDIMLSPSGLGYRLRSIVKSNLHLGPTAWRIPATIGFTAAMVAPLALCWRQFRTLPVRAEGRYALLFFAAALGCVALLPPMLPGQWAVMQRFPVFLLLATITLGSTLEFRWTRAARIGTVVVLSLHAALYVDYFLDFQRANRQFRPDIFDGVSQEDRVAAVIYETDFRDQPLYLHFGDYFTIWRGGESASAMAHFRFGVVRHRADRPALPRAPLWIEGAKYDGRYSDLDYLLVHGAVPSDQMQFYSDFELVQDRAPWLLFRHRPVGSVRHDLDKTRPRTGN